MSQYQNLLLASLPLPISGAIVSASEFVHYDLREKIIEPNVPIKFIHFIESGVMSLLKVMQDGSHELNWPQSATKGCSVSLWQ
jgi:hypothetical protein